MNKSDFLKNIKFGRPTPVQIIFWVAALALTIGGFFFVRGLVTCWNFPTLPMPGRAPSSCGTVTASNQPV
ncbi:MAG: hypothetical protein M3R47_16715, partial [Chloroflexota bacterium]|nr:hypothetical protein [Chloroflexota bacterium]